MIVTKYAGEGGGGYVLPTATASRLGGIKVGSGLSVDSGGTLSAEGGGNYIIVDDLSAVTNPQEGMIAYVKSHTALTAYTVYKVDLSGVNNVDGWMSINYMECIYLNAYDGGVQSLRLDGSGDWDLAGQWLNQWVPADSVSYSPSVVHAWMFDGAVLNIAVNDGTIYEARYGTISGETGTYSETVTIPGASFIYNSGWTETGKPVIYLNELNQADTAALFAALTSSGKSFFDYDIRWYDDSDRAFAVQLTAFRSGIGWTGTIWLSGYANRDYRNRFVVVQIESSGSKSSSIQDIPVINSDARMRIDDSGNCIDMMNIEDIWMDIAYNTYNEFKGLEKYIYYSDYAGNTAKGFIRSVRRDSTNEESGYDIIYISATIDMPDGNSYTGKWHWNHQDTSQGVTKDSWTQIQ